MECTMERNAMGQADWRSIETALHDGTEIMLHILHPNLQFDQENPGRWEQDCVGHWIDHNGGGWTWKGMFGHASCWRPLAADDQLR